MGKLRSPAPPAGPSSHDRILRAGRDLFSEAGYEGTTTSAIARRAGTSESQLIKHFGSKEGLLEAIFDQAWQRMTGEAAPILEAPSLPLEKLRGFSELMIAALEEDRQLRTLLLLEGRRIRKHGNMVILTRGFRQMLAILDDLVRRLQASGELRRQLHPQALRSALLGALEGLLRDQLLAERDGFPAAYDGAELRTAFQTALAGFLASP